MDLLKKTTFLICTVAIIVPLQSSNETCNNKVTEHDVDKELFGRYKPMLPKVDDNAVVVTTEMHIQDITSLNELTNDFEIDILFSQMWHDDDLKFSDLNFCKKNITMESHKVDRVWTPNVCIINSKRAIVHYSPTVNQMFILYENGTVWINYRLQVKAPCNLDLTLFPFDMPICEIILESYSYNAEQVRLQWLSDAPLTLMKYIILPEFDLEGWTAENFTILYPNGLWDRLKITFVFTRRYGFYVLLAYIPTSLTTMVSWVSFCMDVKSLPSRTTIGVSALLALTFQFGNILKNLPRVSYIKSMDVWMFGCIAFVFGSMVELAIVCYIARMKKEKEQNETMQVSKLGQVTKNDVKQLRPDDLKEIQSPVTFLSESTENDNELLSENSQTWLTNRFRLMNGKSRTKKNYNLKQVCKKEITSKDIDLASLWIFPVCFAVFIIIYWIYYMCKSQSVHLPVKTKVEYNF